MPEYDNTNRWTLFKNDRKEKDSQPDFTGTIDVNGVQFYLNGWEKNGKNGPFISGSIKLKDTTADAPKPAGTKSSLLGATKADMPPAGDPAFDDQSIPF